MAHANARTSLFARRLIVERVAAGWSLGPLLERYRCGAVAGERPLPGEGYRAGSAVVFEAGVAADVDGAAVLVDDAAADPEPKAGAGFALRSEEGFGRPS